MKYYLCMRNGFANSLSLLCASDTCLLIDIHASYTKKEFWTIVLFVGLSLDFVMSLKAWFDPLHRLGAMDCWNSFMHVHNERSLVQNSTKLNLNGFFAVLMRVLFWLKKLVSIVISHSNAWNMECSFFSFSKWNTITHLFAVANCARILLFIIIQTQNDHCINMHACTRTYM